MKVVPQNQILTAEQFLFIDGIDGIKTSARAEELGLSVNGPGNSKLWELESWDNYSKGWEIVDHSDWILTGYDGRKYVKTHKEFMKNYVLISE